MPRLLACTGALLALAVLPASASAAPKTQVFKMKINVNVSTEWSAWGENQVCSDWRRILTGNGVQHLNMEVKDRLVTFRGGRLAYPGTKGTMSLPMPKVGKVVFAPLHGKVFRKADYELTHTGRGESCVPGFSDNEEPSTATCGSKTAKGGFYALVPNAGTLKLTAMSLLDDPYGGECPVESNAAITLPEPVEITHGKDALKQLANPRIKKVVVQGMSDDIKTNDDWGMGEEHGGEQTSDVLWYATFRRVG